MDFAPLPPSFLALFWLYCRSIFMFTFAPVCAHLSKWCPNNSFYRILTNLTSSTLYRSYLLEPTSPPAGHWPREARFPSSPISHRTVCWQSAPCRRATYALHASSSTSSLSHKHTGDWAWFISCKHLFYEIGFDCIVGKYIFWIDIVLSCCLFLSDGSFQLLFGPVTGLSQNW